jgi:thiamine-phosphate pyrophosphorylase
LLNPRELRLMVVTTGTLAPLHGHRRLASAAIDGGATAVQLRAPELPEDELLPLSLELAERCREAGVRFIVNDRMDVALASGADGVHLGQSDEIADARARLGPASLLGISVADATQARAARDLGADYLGVTVWSTKTKPEARGVGPVGIHEIREAVDLPVVGIGGIDADNLGAVLGAGAAGIAVISAVAGDPDPVAATRTLRRRIDELEGVVRGATHR